jgi:hypothetical protein
MVSCIFMQLAAFLLASWSGSCNVWGMTPTSLYHSTRMGPKSRQREHCKTALLNSCFVKQWPSQSRSNRSALFGPVKRRRFKEAFRIQQRLVPRVQMTWPAFGLQGLTGLTDATSTFQKTLGHGAFWRQNCLVGSVRGRLLTCLEARSIPCNVELWLVVLPDSARHSPGRKFWKQEMPIVSYIYI